MLNMRSAHSDVTARARIRDAAVTLFGRDGFAGTSMRAIASGAGVSPALVVHHFGSKEGLRDACDEHLLRLVREGKQAAMTSPGPPSLEAYLATVGDAEPLLRYLARLLHEGGPAAVRIYTGMVDDAVDYLADAERAGTIGSTPDPRARATLLVGWGLSNLLLGPLAAHALAAPDEVTAAVRIAGPALEIYTHGLFTDTRFLDGFHAEGRRPQGESS